MTIKEMFKKIDTYNEVAELMRTDKAYICFCDIYNHTVKDFENLDSIRKFIRKEYFKPVADKLLNATDWEFDAERTIEWIDNTGYTNICKFSLELGAC